ncbi:MarR family transcriptional regulator [Rhizobium sp. ERR 922]|nr:winged helix-turn-helix transcriptional regulator [Rhizobium sp. AG207R]TWB09260.1 MarR family transcriptional regulator [Rhizobium sp. ERR1071]TWB49125.1 MarR family transcriptional regulator [Rhizobium sp. ERR 922]TWB91657.1 MarR family transcriptional regulator [Rhizobium sp. ERR 942]
MDIDTRASRLSDPLDALLGYQLRRASNVMMADLGSRLQAIELRPVEASILTLIDANPGCTQSDLGRSLGIQRANMVPLMVGLTKAGLVDRAPVGGRSRALRLTRTGSAKLETVHAIIEAHEARFRRLFAPELREAALEVLRGIRQEGEGVSRQYDREPPAGA